MENRRFKRLWANITMFGLVITQFSTGVFPIPIAPIDNAYAINTVTLGSTNEPPRLGDSLSPSATPSVLEQDLNCDNGDVVTSIFYKESDSGTYEESVDAIGIGCSPLLDDGTVDSSREEDKKISGDFSGNSRNEERVTCPSGSAASGVKYKGVTYSTGISDHTDGVTIICRSVSNDGVGSVTAEPSIPSLQSGNAQGTVIRKCDSDELLTGITYDHFNPSRHQDNHPRDLVDSVALYRCKPVELTPVHTSGNGFFIEKTRDDAAADEPVAPGDTIRYKITIENNDTKVANARIIDPVPPELEFVSGSSGCDYIAQTDEIICAQQPLAIGRTRNVKLTFRVKDSVQACTTIENQADVWNDDPNYPQGIPPSWSNVIETPVECPDPELTALKTVNVSTAEPGDRIQYTIEVENIGQGDANNVVISDRVQSGLIFDAVRSSSACAIVGDRIECDLETIREGRDKDVNIVFTLSPDLVAGQLPCGQNVDNNADVSSSNAPSVTSNTVQTSITCPATPEIEILKSVSNSTPEIGDTINFRFDITKTGDSALRNIVLQDTYPAGLRFVRSTGRTCSESSGTIVCDPFNLSRSETTDQIWLEFVVESTTLCNNTVENYGTIHATGVAQKHSNTVNFTTVCANPDLEITKTGPSTVDAGDNVVYTITVKNTGSGIAEDVYIHDFFINNTTQTRIPSPFTYKSVSGATCTYQNTSYVCSVGDIQPGSTKTVTVTFKAEGGQSCDDTIMNQADVHVNNIPGDASDWDKHQVTVRCANPEFRATKTVDKTNAQIGDRLTYDITIENTGTVTLGGTWVIDTIPTGLTFNSGLSDNRCFKQGNDVKCGDDEVPVGNDDTYTLVFDVNSNAVCNANMYNTARLVFMDNNGLSGTTNQVQTRITCANPEADISLEKTAIGQIFRGTTIQYTLTVENNGPDTAENVRILDVIPDVKKQSAHGQRISLVYNRTASDSRCQKAGNDIVCNLNSMTANAVQNVTIAFDVPSDAECSAAIINEAVVESTTHDPLLSNNDDSAASTVNCATQTLDVTKNGPASVIRGNEIEYTIVVTNNLGFDTTRNRMIDPVPSDLQFLRSNDNLCHYEQQTDEVICGDFDLRNGQSRTFILTFTVRDTAVCDSTITNIGDIWSHHPGVDPQWSNAVRTDVLCADPVLTITKTDNRTTAARNDILTYEINMRNHSNFDATGVEIIDALPDDVTFLSANLNGNFESTTHTVLWNLDIAAGETLSLTVRARVNNNTIHGKILYNHVAITGGDNDTDTTTVQVAQPTFSIAKTDNRSVIGPGERNYYDITVSNTSTTDAQDVEIIDFLPSNVSFVVATPPLGVNAPRIIGNTVVWITDILAGRSTTLRLGVKVDEDAKDGDAVLNTVCVNGGTCDDDTTTVVKNDPTFSITKTDHKTIANPGERLTYDIFVTNTSNVDAKNVTIIDTLPLNVTFGGASAPAGVDDIDHVGNEVIWITDLDAGESVLLTVDVIVDTNANDGDLLYNRVKIVNGPDAADTTIVTVDEAIVGCIDVQKETFNQNGAPLHPVTQFTFFLNGSDDTVLNDSNGNARFTNVPVGTHTVTEQVPSGWIQQLITPTNGRVVVHEGSDCVTVTFKNRQEAVGTPNFTINKTDNKSSANPGETLHYVITVRNTGTKNATNVVVTDSIPDDVHFLSADNGGIRSGNTVTWTFNLNAGATKTLGMSVRVDNNADDSDTIRNTACVSGGPCDDDNTTVETNDDDDDDDDDDNDEDISISVNDDPDPIDVCNDDDLEYEIRITNRGNANERVDVIASLDSDTEYRSSSDGGKERSGDRVEWDNIKVNRNSSRTLRLRVRVDNDVRDGDTLRLRTAVSGGDEDTEITRVRNRNCIDDDDEGVPVAGQPNLTIDKTADRTEALAGSVASYTITIRNTGNRDIRNATLSDDYPESMMTISDPGGGRDQGGVLAWNLGTLKANSTTVVRYRVRVKESVAQGSTIRNTATVQGEGLTRSDTHTIVVPRPPVTGLGGFIKGIAGTADFLTPRVNAAEPSPAVDPALPMTVWLTTIFMGLGFGGTFGRKFLF